MFTRLWLFGICAALVGAPTATRAEEQKPIVVVFDMEDRGSGVAPAVLDNLTEYLAVLVAERGYQVVPRDQIRERLVDQKKASYKSCYDQSCQIELGRELAAQKVLATRILKIADTCQVGATLYDLGRAATEKAASAESTCSEKSLLQAVKTIADRLALTPAAAAAAPAAGAKSAPGGPAGSLTAGTPVAASPLDSTYRLGFTVGPLSPSSGDWWAVRMSLEASGTAASANARFNIDPGFWAEAYFDWRFAKSWSLGAALSFFNARTLPLVVGDAGIRGDQFGVLSAGARVRLLLRVTDSFAIRPGLFLGLGAALAGREYRLSLDTAQFDLAGSVGVSFGLSADFAWYPWQKIGLVASLGVISGAVLKKKLESGTLNTSFPPFLYFSLGMEFGL